MLVTLGGPSAKVLLNTTEGVLKLRGNWRIHRTASGTEIPVMPTLHPAYLLRNPAHKKLAWRDFLEVKAGCGRWDRRQGLRLTYVRGLAITPEVIELRTAFG